jgi:hypothetical protein
MSAETVMAGFLAFSSELTGFSIFDLRGTGEATAYLDAATDVVGEDVVAALLEVYANLESSGDRVADIRRSILGDPWLGPVARNIIKMWFSGVWYALPEAWSSAWGGGQQSVAFAVRPSSYAEGLLWKTIGANPPGAKAPGYGSWAEPPRIPDPESGFSILDVRNI